MKISNSEFFPNYGMSFHNTVLSFFSNSQSLLLLKFKLCDYLHFCSILCMNIKYIPILVYQVERRFIIIYDRTSKLQATYKTVRNAL